MDKSILESFIGKQVKLYPGDTYRKEGVIKDVDDTGILIHITLSHCKSYKVGKLHYISFANKIVLSEL